MKKTLWIMAFASVLGAWGARGGAAFVDPEAKWIFPNRIDAFSFVGAEKYREAISGYSLFYSNAVPASLEISVCTLDVAEIPDGWEGKAIDRAFQIEEATLALQERRNAIFSLKKPNASILPPKASVRFAVKRYAYSEFREGDGDKPTPVIRLLCVTGRSGRFVRLVFSYAEKDEANLRAVLKATIARMAEIVSGPADDDSLVLAACEVQLRDPMSSGGKMAARIVLERAEKESDRLGFYPDLFAWPKDRWRKPDNADLLVIAYTAGVLKTILPEGKSEGGEFEGFLAMLDAYGIMRAKDQIQAIPKLDEWRKAPDKKALFEKLLTVEEESAPEEE